MNGTKQDMIECCRWVHDKGFVAANDGNLSIRLDDQRILATPTGMSKGRLKEDDLVIVDRKGGVVEGSRKPSSELLMHLRIYDIRPDVNAVVHAHPVYATGFATAHIPLDKCVLAEVVSTLGSIPIAPYATPSTSELPDAITGILQHADACLLANHGVVTCGSDLFDAYYKMERVEHYARIIFVARLLGGERPLNGVQVEKLAAIRSTYGTQHARNPGCVVCEGDCVGSDCSLYESRGENDRFSSIIRDVISRMED